MEVFRTSLHFIRNNLTGWTILILVIIIIYFVALRKYYIRKEQFYDHTIYKKNTEKTFKISVNKNKIKGNKSIKSDNEEIFTPVSRRTRRSQGFQVYETRVFLSQTIRRSPFRPSSNGTRNEIIRIQATQMETEQTGCHTGAR